MQLMYKASKFDTRALARFARDNPDWHSFTPDHRTVSVVCAAHNLGLIIVNEHDQFTGRPEAIARYIAAKEA